MGFRTQPPAGAMLIGCRYAAGKGGFAQPRARTRPEWRRPCALAVEHLHVLGVGTFCARLPGAARGAASASPAARQATGARRGPRNPRSDPDQGCDARALSGTRGRARPGGPLEGEARPAGTPPHHHLAYAARHLDGVEVPPFRPVDGRSHPGRPCRPARGCRALRAGARRAFLDLCDLVDPRLDPGLHSAQLVDRARRHQFGAEGAVLQPAQAEGAPRARAGNPVERRHPPANLDGARRLGGGCCADGFQAFRIRHLAQRAFGRRQRLDGGTD